MRATAKAFSLKFLNILSITPSGDPGGIGFETGFLSGTVKFCKIRVPPYFLNVTIGKFHF